MSTPWLVVGLGNPGPAYAGNRHNVGHMVLEELARRTGARFTSHRTRAQVADVRLGVLPGGAPGPRVVLAKPTSYMNVSGGPVAGLVQYLQVPTDRVVVVHDEIDIPFATVRLKQGGGEGGHNGLRSISSALGTKDQQPASYSPKTGLFYVPTNHVCMDYEPFQVEYAAGQPYVGATLSMYPAPNSHGGMGNFIAWDAGAGKIVWSKPEKFSVWSGALATAGDVNFYGTLEGYIKAVDNQGKELWKFKTPSGIIGNVTTWEYKGKQYIGVLSGIGGWAGIGMAAGLTKDTEGLGAVGGYKELAKYTELGGVLMVFALPGKS